MRLMTVLTLVLVALLAVAAPAAGQEAAENGASADSFAEQFFVARKTDPGREKRIEVLGSAIIWFLLVLSVVSIGLIGNLALGNQRKTILPADVVTDVKRLLAEGEYKRVMEITERDPSFFSRVLRAALGEASHGFGAVIRALEQTADELTAMRLRRLEYLNVVGQVSPMIGLFGTVYGMILAFQAIVVAGGNADPVLLAGGISTALTTTFWGLVVAIPALAGYGVIRNKIDELTAEATLTAEELVNMFRPKPKSGTRAATPEAK
jgi:biopolymer transport protein ExbB